MTATPTGRWDPDDPAAVARALESTGYLADAGLANAAFLALRMGRPLFCEGEPGTGKTALAHALAEVLGAPLVRLQCHEGIDASQALYDWDFPRQLLHLRAAESAATASGATIDADTLEASLYDRRFLLARPILQALQTSPSVLLVDEIDRADDEFEAFLLEVLAENTVTIPEIGVVRAATPPLVVLTSNRTREVHDALKRRCLYLWLEHPDLARETAILRTRLPHLPAELARAGGRRRASPARARPAQAARRGRVAGLGAGPGARRRAPPRPGIGDADPRGGAQVPRGRRPGAGQARRPPGVLRSRNPVRRTRTP